MFWTFIDRAPAEGEAVVFEGPSGHHLARVLRVRRGERGVLVAGGREFESEVVEVEGGRIVARVVGSRTAAGEPAIALTLLQAALPNPDLDAVIEAGTAIGIGAFAIIQAERSIARPDLRRLPRWQSIARSAAEQSHRGRIPEILGPQSLDQALASMSDGRLLILDPSSAAALRSAIDGSRGYRIAVGPEGGWSEQELRLMRDQGGIAVHLGPRILRARLAAVVAAAILVQQS